MRRLGVILSLCGTICLSGCFAIDTAKLRTTQEEHIVVSNYGWTLFNSIPLCCGNARDGEYVFPWVFLRDDVTMEKIQGRFMKYVAQSGRTATNLTYHNYETVMFSFPFTSVNIPIPYILCYREIQISGVLK